MKNQMQKKLDLVSNEFVKLGGWWAAIFSPVAIVIVGFIIPFADASVLTFLLKLMQIIWFKWFLFFMAVLPIWYGLNRIVVLLCDWIVQAQYSTLLFYGLAIAWSAHVGYVLFILG